MRNEEEIKIFDEGVGELALTKDPTMLSKLIDLFDDNCQFSEVMYSLVHAIETYPDDVYVKTILSKVDKGIKEYPRWFVILLYRILNHDDSLIIFRQNMHLASKETLLKLFDIMEEESPHHKDMIQELRKELDKA